MDESGFVDYIVEKYENNPNSNVDRFGKEYVKESFSVRVELADETRLSWGESYIGTPFRNTVERRDPTYPKLKSGEMDKQELATDVRNDIIRFPSVNDFVETESAGQSRFRTEMVGVHTGVVAVVRKDGYAVCPDESQTVSV